MMILPFSAVCEILQILPTLLSRGVQTELICKISMFLLKLHYAPIIANQYLLGALEKLLRHGNQQVKELRDLIGYNYYGIKFIQKEVEAADSVQLFRDASRAKTKANRKQKQREKLKKSIMAFN
uniref:WD repeat-containing protein 3-like n=1 Tax=Diabrotica virgifera virgifera TaxID=50390 RepID=A0A6P7GEH8_DIAVI